MEADFVIEITVLAFLLYLGGSSLVGSGGLFLRTQSQNELAVYLRRIWGFICLLGVPLLFASDYIVQQLAKVGFSIEQLVFSLQVWLGASLMAVIVSFRRAKAADNMAQYPQIRFRPWNKRIMVLSSLSWLLYLFAYEFLFRGWLLFGCIDQFGYIEAVGINVILYSLAHIHKGRVETIGAIPLGVLFCVFTIWTGSIWTAFLVHCSIAISTEWFSAYNAGLLPFNQNFNSSISKS